MEFFLSVVACSVASLVVAPVAPCFKHIACCSLPTHSKLLYTSYWNQFSLPLFIPPSVLIALDMFFSIIYVLLMNWILYCRGAKKIKFFLIEECLKEEWRIFFFFAKINNFFLQWKVLVISLCFFTFIF